MKVNELLWYMSTVLQSSTKEKTKDVVLSFYDVAEIAEAKITLYDDHKEIVGKPTSRRGSSRRSEEEADMSDILEAFEKLDKAKIIPEYCARNGNRVPLILPENRSDHQSCSMNVKSIERRLAQLEMAFSEKQTTQSRDLSYSNVAQFPSLPTSDSHLVQFRPSPNMLQSTTREHAARVNLPPLNRVHQSASNGQRTSQRQNNPRSRSDVTIGTGGNKSIGNSGLKGAPPPKRDFFIYRVDKGETRERVSDHLKCLGVDIIHLERTSHEDANFASFRLTTYIGSLETIMNPDNWPQGIRVRPFYQKRTSSFPNNNNSDLDGDFRIAHDQETEPDRDSINLEDEHEETNLD